MINVRGTIFFMDGSSLTLSWPKQTGTDPTMLATTVKNALDSDKLIVEVDRNLMVIPMRNIKYIQITPAPETLPAGVVRGAQIIE